VNFLIIGNGGREHAFAWKISQSSLVQKVFIAPGNAGTERENKCENINIDSEDISALRDFAIEKSIDLTIVGPEAPLVKGIVDEFEKHKLLILGPSKKASQIEGSKKFMKDFLKKNHIRTAEYEVFEDYEDSKEYISKSKFPIVIKADGLAAGKGVTIAHSAEEAHKALDDAMQKKIFGSAGTKVVIEDFLQGEEASFIVLCDGKKTIPFASSQDHKARDNNDLGPNTGGMGAYSPAPIVTEEIHKQVMEKIIKPTIDGLKSEGITYKGFLYAGLMIKNSEISVLEFNCRFGDPETQPILMRMESDLAEICLLAAQGNLNEREISWTKDSALGVVIASKGYPFEYEKNKEINNLENENPRQKVFHAGTKTQEGRVLSNGGRVLCVTALGSTLLDSKNLAYQKVKNIDWKDGFYRDDIGDKAIKS